MKNHCNAIDISSPAATIRGNKTRQGYARERILKLAGYFFPAFAEKACP